MIPNIRLAVYVAHPLTRGRIVEASVFGAKRLRRLRKALTPHRLASSAPRLWLRKPGALAGRDVCVFVTYDPRAVPRPHVLFHARAWSAQGFVVVLVIVADDLATASRADVPEGFDGVMVRANAGYDFAAWASAIGDLGDLYTARTLVLVNDSVYGPLGGLAPTIAKVRASEGALVGAVYSDQMTPHFQSFLLFFKNEVLRSHAFKTFWATLRMGDRDYAIDKYELTLKAYFEQHGFTTDALFGLCGGHNPTLTGWRELVSQGFPYIKVQLLRDNPFRVDLGGWRDAMMERGFDPAMVVDHLGDRIKE